MHLTQQEFDYICILSLNKNITLDSALEIYLKEVHDIECPKNRN